MSSQNFNKHYDIIIVGTGAGGGTLARHLAPSGKSILLVERGDWLKREAENWNPRSVFIDNRYVSKEQWLSDRGDPFQPQVHYFVGGATKLYGAALYRMRKEDFGELQHHDGISPEWPISYEDLKPYYAIAEKIYCVHGRRGDDPTEPPGEEPYPYPQVSHEPRIEKLYNSLKRVGIKAFYAPCAIMLNESDMPNSRCIRCQTCDGFPCLVQAKADAEMVGVRPALKYPNVTLLTNTEAIKLITKEEGKAVKQLIVQHEGEQKRLSADLFVLSCSAVNSAKLLLQSADEYHPRGLANGSDQVGRNYMFHNSQAVLALSKEPNPTLFQKTLAINDFYFGTEEFPYPMGNIQMIGKSVKEMFQGEKPLETAFAPKMVLESIAQHAVDFWLTTEDLPKSENRIRLTREGQVQISYKPNNQQPKEELFKALKNLLGQIDMHPHQLIPRHLYMKTDIPLAAVAHQAGTCRFGKEPGNSVLDVNCKAHELDNLYVVDTSFFPSISAVNPSLTAIANALRVGDHLLERLR